MKGLQFIRDWMLVIAMLTGVAAYFTFASIPQLHAFAGVANEIVSVAQPALIFTMLFLTFCKVDLRDMRLCRWHLWLLLIQGGLFTAFAGLVLLLPDEQTGVILEGAMICFICPTATAAAVVTRKLGGDVAHITTYTVLINILNSVLVPFVVPYIRPDHGMSMAAASWMIMGKVFPLLLMPLVCAILLRVLLPAVRKRIARYQELSFYLWAIALALAIAVTARSVVHSTVPVSTQLWLVAVSFVACGMQFYIGRRIGSAYDDKTTAGQALGQKNTVLAIWMGYTFFNPVTALAGGFYSIWHNVVNSWQLYRHNKIRVH